MTPAPDEAAVGRVFREASGRSVATLIRVFGDIDIAEDAVQEAYAIALRRWARDGLPPNPGGWITTTARNLAIDRLRRESRGRELLADVAAALARPRPGHAGGGRTRAGRPAAAHLHVLPSGARPGSPGGAHAAAARRPLDRAGRARVPGRGADDGPAARAGQAQDQGGADPVPRAGGSRAARPPPAGARGRLPDLQRRHGGRGARRGGDPAGAAVGDPDARRAGGRRPAGAAAADRVTSRVANRARRRRSCCSASRTARAGTGR